MLQKSLMRLFQFLSKSNPPVPILPHNFQLLMLIEGGGGGGHNFQLSMLSHNTSTPEKVSLNWNSVSETPYSLSLLYNSRYSLRWQTKDTLNQYLSSIMANSWGKNYGLEANKKPKREI